MQSDNNAPPYDALVEHVAQCKVCSAALLILLSQIAQPVPDVSSTAIEICEADLAAYIDMEREIGLIKAIRSYPHVWWRLWTDQDFAETYRLTQTLLDAEATGHLAPMPLHNRAITRLSPIPRLKLPRQFLHYALAARATLGETWGADDLETTISDEHTVGYQFTVSVYYRPEGTWCFIAKIAPPITGYVHLTLGASVFHAPFDSNGTALIDALPADLLLSSDGPDMVIDVAPAIGAVTLPAANTT